MSQFHTMIMSFYHAFFRNKGNIVLFLIALVLLLENFVLAANNLQNRTPIVGLRIGGHSLTRLSSRNIQQLIQQDRAKNKTMLTFLYDGKFIPVHSTDIITTMDPAMVANELLQIGRTGNIITRFVEQQKALFGFTNLTLPRSISQTQLTLKILEIQQEVNQDATPIMPDFTGDIQKTIPARQGVKVQTDKLTLLITNAIFHPPSSPLPLPVYTVFPNVHQENELAPIRKQVPQFLNGIITIASGGQTFTLTPNDIRGMLTVVERPNPKDPKKFDLLLRIDDTKLNQKLGEFAARVEAITHAEFDDHDARVAIYSELYSNQKHIVNIPTGKKFIAQSPVLGVQTQSGPKIVYLTFDDGPNTIYHQLILDILRQYHVRATFFFVGQNIPPAHDAAVQTVNDGHAIGNHSLTHSFLPNFSSAFVTNELEKTDNILKSITGGRPVVFFRPPYGGINSYVIHNAHALGLRIFLWDVDPRDWSEPPVNELVRRVVTATHNGSNILFHSNHLVTAKALPKIIETLTAQGYTFQTLDTHPQQEQL